MKTTKLEKLNACRDAIEWVKTRKSDKDAWMNCERGDWMLWLAKKLDVDDRKLTLAKATCANQVRHLMKDQKSLDAIDACFKYAKGEITREKLNVYASSAYAAYYADASAADADASADASASYASSASSASDAAAYYAASASSAADAAYYAAYASAAASAYAASSAADASYAAAKMESLKKSAEICREILTEEVLKKYKNKK